VGGSACPESIIRTFEDNHRIEVIHAWGMTETSPLATVGQLKIKGPTIAAAYYEGEGGEVLHEEGFFDTGDVSTFGYMQITDRAKDVIKSGGQWISAPQRCVRRRILDRVEADACRA
jgi:fatty-acyl-CoA synthase